MGHKLAHSEPVTHRNHYVPRWYQKLFARDPESGLIYLDLTPESTPASGSAGMARWKRRTSKYCFWQDDLYTTTFLGVSNDDIEKYLFGDIDNDGATAVRAVAAADLRRLHPVFQRFFEYLDAQKLRTPKGLDWIRGQYPKLDQQNLMNEMQHLRQMHCTMWTEAVREIVSAEDSDVKFIITDHPVTVYHPECPPNDELCVYPNDPDIALKGSQTLFPLGPSHCLILTNLEYARDPDRKDLLSERTNARRFGNSISRIDTWIRSRRLSSAEVISINYILKSRARRFIAGDEESWLYPERTSPTNWRDCGRILLPPRNQLYHFEGELYIGHEDGTSSYRDAYGRTSKSHELLRKPLPDREPEPEDRCPCGSGLRFGGCCKDVPPSDRMPWDVYSVRERNLMHLRAIENILGLTRGKTWEEARRELSDEQVAEIHRVFAALWPRETSLADLLPRPNPNAIRAVYVGIVDPRTIPVSVIGWLSYFDEVILTNPFMHAENVKPEYSPIVSPSQYKQQTIMNVALLSQLAPFIHAGRVHLIPDPLQFNDFLRDTVWEMARSKQAIMKLEKEDRELGIKLGEDSFRRLMARLPEDVLRHQFKMADPNITEEMLRGAIEHLRAEQAADPLALLQPLEEGGEMQGFRGMNFELAMFLGQLTGAAIYSDQRITRGELDAARRPAEGEQAVPDDIEEILHLRFSLFRNYQSQAAEIDRHAKVRRDLSHLWQCAARIGEADDAKSIALALDGVQQHSSEAIQAGESLDGQEDPEAVFDIDVQVVVPPNGYVLNAVQRFLVSFGRRNRLDSVPLAFLFGKAAAGKSEAKRTR